MNGKRVLVTGGSGFIGGAIAETLQTDNDVRVLDLDPAATPPDGVSVIEGDVRDRQVVNEAVADVDVVFHQAAIVSVAQSVADPMESHAVNATGTLQVLEAARRHGSRVVGASSAAIYGDPERVPIAESAPLAPTSPYGLNKLALDHYLRLYHDLYDLDTVALRYFNVYGPGQTGGDYAGVMEAFLEQAQAGDPLTVHGDGEQTRDFVHIDDVVRANILAAETDAVGTAYNVGTGHSVTISDLAERVRHAVGSDSPIVTQEAREGDVRHSRADLTRSTQELGYQSAVSLDAGIATLADERDTSDIPVES